MPGFKTLPGFRDFYPDDLAVRAYIMGTWRDVARRYGFREYDGPPLEPLELYTEKSGPEIVQQLYNFTDKGAREVALRPEMTPTLARMVGARANGLRKPIKWFAIPQLFRYERQQRGRLREHFQLNLDIIGEDDVAADAELLAAAIDMLRAFGLTEADFVARVSDRRLLQMLFLRLGVQVDQLPLAYNIVDKLEREGKEGVARRLRDELGLSSGTADDVVRIFEFRSFEDFNEHYWQDYDPELRDIGDLFASLAAMGLEDFVRFDLSIVRGLAYYSGTVFELFDTRGELRAICGGGRYDDLLKQISGVDLSALGFGMGDVVLTELLKDRGLLPNVRQSIDYYLVAENYNSVGENDKVRRLLLQKVHELRDAGYSAEYSLAPALRNRQFKEASALGARKVVVVTAEDAARGSVPVPELSS